MRIKLLQRMESTLLKTRFNFVSCRGQKVYRELSGAVYTASSDFILEGR